MNSRKIIGFSTVLMLIFSSFTIPGMAEIQNEPQAVFSLEPTGEDLEILNSQPKQSEPRAWIVSPTGKKTPTQVVSEDELKGLVEYRDNTKSNNKNGGITTLDFSEDYGTYIYNYVWQSYLQDYNSTDAYKFFQGSCSIENRTGSNITLKYIQSESKSNTWSVTGKVDIEAEFKVAMLAKLKANIGGSVTNTWTTSSSSTIETTMTVRPGYLGKLSRYKQGAYSGGAGSWKKYKLVKATGEDIDMGLYYETGTAWGICQNIDNYKAVETQL
jgi:hypothetical protein